MEQISNKRHLDGIMDTTNKKQCTDITSLDETEHKIPDALQVVTLNVGGTMFYTTKQTILSYPGTYLYKSLTGLLPITNGKTMSTTPITSPNYLFVDRNPELFKHILEYYRTGGFCCKPSECDYTALYIEAQFFGLTELCDELEPELAKCAYCNLKYIYWKYTPHCTQHSDLGHSNLIHIEEEAKNYFTEKSRIIVCYRNLKHITQPTEKTENILYFEEENAIVRNKYPYLNEIAEYKDLLLCEAQYQCIAKVPDKQAIKILVHLSSRLFQHQFVNQQTTTYPPHLNLDEIFLLGGWNKTNQTAVLTVETYYKFTKVNRVYNDDGSVQELVFEDIAFFPRNTCCNIKLDECKYCPKAKHSLLPHKPLKKSS
jgi:hypothetical protein